MQRLSFLALVGVLFTLCTAHASAIAEFCPANILIKPVSPNPDAPSLLYGFELTADGKRTVTAAVAVDTDSGWFSVAVPAAALHEKDRHYKGPSADFIRREWTSDIMYVRFSKPVIIAHSWVYEAKTEGDNLGWARLGEVLCSPYAAGNSRVKLPPENPATAFVTKDEDHVEVAPAQGSLILAATRSAPLGKSDCADPFEDAAITKQASPDYPEVMRSSGLSATTSVEVAINADGTLADAWIWGPSGYQAFDDASLAAARRSNYKAGRAYCQPAPGFYQFKVSFVPRF